MRIEVKSRVALVVTAIGTIDIDEHGITTAGETRLAGITVFKRVYLDVPWSEIADILWEADNPTTVKIVPRRVAYFIPPIYERGLLRIRPRVDANGYLVMRLSKVEVAQRIAEAARAELARVSAGPQTMQDSDKAEQKA